MTILTLVRHGETDWNLGRRIQGSTDIALNDTGRAQARAAAQHLGDRLTDGVPTVLASSDLSRAHETARIIADELGLAAPATYPGLRERSYGEAEGLTDVDFAERWGAWHTAVVPGAEPWEDVAARALTAIRTVVADARRLTAPQSPDVIVVAHGALIRAVMEHASGGAYPERGHKLANGSAHTFRIERDRLTLLDSPVLTR